MDMLEREREKYIVVPAINWLVATTYEAEAFGYAYETAEKAGYKRELDVAVAENHYSVINPYLKYRGGSKER
jgi:hypothetical protein